MVAHSALRSVLTMWRAVWRKPLAHAWMIGYVGKHPSITHVPCVRGWLHGRRCGVECERMPRTYMRLMVGSERGSASGGKPIAVQFVPISLCSVRPVLVLMLRRDMR